MKLTYQNIFSALFPNKKARKMKRRANLMLKLRTICKKQGLNPIEVAHATGISYRRSIMLREGQDIAATEQELKEFVKILKQWSRRKSEQEEIADLKWSRKYVPSHKELLFEPVCEREYRKSK